MAKKVLIVDDEKDIVELITYNLKKKVLSQIQLRMAKQPSQR